MCIELGTNALPINILIHAVRNSTAHMSLHGTIHLTFKEHPEYPLIDTNGISMEPQLVYSCRELILRENCFFIPDCCDGATALL